MKNQKGFTPIIIIIVVLLGIGGYYFIGREKPNKIFEAPSSTTDPFSDWNFYKNGEYAYSLRYPSNWVLKSIEPGIGEIPLDNTSRGIILYPSNYKSSLTAKTFIQLETDGPSNTAFASFDDWIENNSKPFYKVTSSNSDGFNGLVGKSFLGTYDGYGYPVKIKSFAVKSEKWNVYYSIIASVEQNSVEMEIVDQILSTFKFIE